MNDVRERLFASLEQIFLFLKLNDSKSGYTLDCDDVINWFRKVDQRLENHYKEIGQCASSHYRNRNVTVIEDEVFCCIDELKKLLKGFIDCHFVPDIRIELSDFVFRFQTIQGLLAERLIGNVVIIINNTECSITKDELNRMLSDMVPYCSNFRMVGTYDTLMHYGVFSMSSVCSLCLELDVVDYEIDQMYPDRKKSCREKFATHIFFDGYVYPCEGLIGLTNSAIDKINASPDELNIYEERRKPLLGWYKEGPSITSEDICVESDSLPYYCRRHRAQLIEESNGTCFDS